MSATIKDIAEAAGVNVGAVSRTLRNHPDSMRLRRETRERIFAVARQLGYERNLVATAMRTGVVKTIAVILPLSENGAEIHFARSLSGILNRATHYGYGVKIYPETDLENTFSEILGGKMSCLVSMGVDPEIRSRVIAFSKRHSLKLVLCYGMPTPHFPTVDMDNFTSAVKAVDYLVSLGHRRIAFLGSRLETQDARMRYEGYLHALKKAGISPAPELMDFSDDFESVPEKMLLYPKKKRPTAFLTAADIRALFAENIAVRLGRKIPQEISFFGFGDFALGRAAFAPLSTVREFHYRIGELALDILLGKPVELKPDEDNSYLIQSKLVIRKSTASPEDAQKTENKDIHERRKAK
ncbi:MAG: HTH-type transcriptional repressor CytR [Lentisphaerae bacterium ADurb.Bin242]|nr:MAG: HTH-type transcriptional repressor CytR [Lentisphaerae bacterium ADurb.Bin242]